MNLGIISLIALLAAIIIGFVRNANVGILCMGFSMVLGLVFGLDAKEILSGFSSSLFIQMVGITYLFAIINSNGTLELLARKMVGLVKKKKALIPFVMYILGFLICAVGPGAIPSLAIIPVIAIPVAVSAGINPIMTAIIGDLGVMSGRMSPLTPEAAVVRELMEDQGLVGNTIPIMIGMTITALIVVVLVYIYYKGWKVEKHEEEKEETLPKFNGKQWLSLIGLLVLAVGVLFFSWNVGLTGFLVGTVLIVLGCGEEKKGIKGIPWNVILMVLGVGILMNVISLSGGIDIMVAGLEKNHGTPYCSNDHGNHGRLYVILQLRSWCCVPDTDPDCNRSCIRPWSRSSGTCDSYRNRRNRIRIYTDIHNWSTHHGRCSPAGKCGRKIPAEQIVRGTVRGVLYRTCRTCNHGSNRSVWVDWIVSVQNKDWLRR